jgi:hypothetical protein
MIPTAEQEKYYVLIGDCIGYLKVSRFQAGADKFKKTSSRAIY